MNSSAYAVILHVGVNDILKDNSQSNTENLGKNLRSVVEKCHTYGIKNVFISGLVYTAKIGQFLRRLIVHLCKKLGTCYEDNRNVRRKHLWKDSLHLVEPNMLISANNFLS